MQRQQSAIIAGVRQASESLLGQVQSRDAEVADLRRTVADLRARLTAGLQTEVPLLLSHLLTMTPMLGLCHLRAMSVCL